MEIIIQFVQGEKNPTAEALVREKLDDIYKKYDWLIRADVFFKEEKDSNRGRENICEIRLSCPGPRIFAQSREKSYESAVTKTIDDLNVLLKKRKSELQSY
ncbi:MAG: HPF/RaiA family ribosome-associated protein [Crocinitomicaceae bacterium]